MKKIGYALLILGCLLFCLVTFFIKNIKFLPTIFSFTVFIGGLLIIMDRIINRNKYKVVSVADARIMLAAVCGLIFGLIFFIESLKENYSDYCLTGAWKESDLIKMEQTARADFRKLYHDACKEIIDAMFWMYSYDVTR